MTLGFAEEIVAEALKQSENQQDQALNLLMNSPNLLMMVLNEGSQSKPSYTPSEQDILNIVSMGFTPAQAYGTLKKTGGNIENAVELLISGKGVEESVPAISPPQPEANNAAATSSSPTTATVESVPTPMDTEILEEETRRKEEEKKMVEAEEELVQEHTEDDDVAHLAIDLTEEHNMLSHYKALIMSSNNQ